MGRQGTSPGGVHLGGGSGADARGDAAAGITSGHTGLRRRPRCSAAHDPVRSHTPRGCGHAKQAERGGRLQSRGESANAAGREVRRWAWTPGQRGVQGRSSRACSGVSLGPPRPQSPGTPPLCPGAPSHRAEARAQHVWGQTPPHIHPASARGLPQSAPPPYSSDPDFTDLKKKKKGSGTLRKQHRECPVLKRDHGRWFSVCEPLYPPGPLLTSGHVLPQAPSNHSSGGFRDTRHPPHPRFSVLPHPSQQHLSPSPLPRPEPRPHLQGHPRPPAQNLTHGACGTCHARGPSRARQTRLPLNATGTHGPPCGQSHPAALPGPRPCPGPSPRGTNAG